MKMEETIKLQSFFKILISMFFVNAGSEGFFVRYSIRFVQQVPWLYIRVFSWKCLKCSRSWRNQTRKRLQGTDNCKCLWQSYLLWSNHDMKQRVNFGPIGERGPAWLYNPHECTSTVWFTLFTVHPSVGRRENCGSHPVFILWLHRRSMIPPRMRPGPATRIIQQKPWLNAVRSECSWSRSLADGCHVSTKTISPGSLLTKEVYIPMT